MTTAMAAVPRLLPRLAPLALLAGFLLAAASTAAAAACPDAHLVPASGNLDRVAAATLCLINRQRTLHGLPQLHPEAALAAAAAAHSRDMVARDYFGHVSPSGVGPLARIRRAGYVHPGGAFAIAENIAAAGGPATPAVAVSLWMHSPGHRANILSPAYRDTGVGVATGMPARVGSGRGATYTEDFGATG